jgi:CRP/FNR family transcriptional regulator, nitrogen fixation regulation protein
MDMNGSVPTTGVAMLTELKFGQVQQMQSGVTPRQPMTGPLAMFGCAELTGAQVTFGRNSEIYGEGEESDFVYQVVSGAVRTYKVLSDGRRQISAFYQPGDMFGFEAGPEHWCSAEAVVPSTILLVRRSVLNRVTERDSDVARRLCAHVAAELRRSQDHGLLLIKSAQERVAAFLLDMAGRTPGAASINLPMTRQDMADYLGLTIETVSRMMTQFTESATIQIIASRRIVLRDRAALDELND